MKNRYLKPRVQLSNKPAFAVNPSSPAGRLVSAMIGGRSKMKPGFVIGPELGLQTLILV